MTKFSQRIGITPIKTSVQLDEMDHELRNGLWNALHMLLFGEVGTGGSSAWLSDYSNMHRLFISLWRDHFKIPVDTLEMHWPKLYRQVRDLFFKFQWYEVYDFIEAVVRYYPNNSVGQGLQKLCNGTLEKELSAYRFVDGNLTRITSKEEITEIEDAINTSIKVVGQHLKRSLELLSDRKKPDYRNSIKESISAVESLCKLLANDKSPTLGQALKPIESKIGIHGALKSAFSSLYGYTNDQDGIRHALMC